MRKPDKILQQLVGRWAEKRIWNNTTASRKTFQLKKEHEAGPVPNIETCKNVRQYGQFYNSKCFISCTLGDNCFMTRERKPCLVRNIICNSESVAMAVIEYFVVIDNFFNYPNPLPSSQINIFHVNRLAETWHSTNRCSHSKVFLHAQWEKWFLHFDPTYSCTVNVNLLSGSTPQQKNPLCPQVGKIGESHGMWMVTERHKAESTVEGYTGWPKERKWLCSITNLPRCHDWVRVTW